jgi:hypothetical protein
MKWSPGSVDRPETAELARCFRAYSSSVSTTARTRTRSPLRPFELRLRLPNGTAAVVVMDARNIGEALDKARNALGDVQVIDPS